jgi:hypothetical protein
MTISPYQRMVNRLTISKRLMNGRKPLLPRLLWVASILKNCSMEIGFAVVYKYLLVKYMEANALESYNVSIDVCEKPCHS